MKMESEETPLLNLKETTVSQNKQNQGLGLPTVICYLVGVFGVVPIVALPGAIEYCGVSGFVVFCIMLLVESYTATLLGKSWLLLEVFWPQDAANNRRYPYPALAEKVGGPVLRRTVNVMQDLAIFGAAVPFLLLASENLQKVILEITNGKVNFSFCYCLVVTTIFLIPFLWIGTPKDLRHLTWIAAGSVFVVSMLVMYLLVTEAPRNPTPPEYIPSWGALAYCFGAVAFQFDNHTMILTVQMDMKEKHRLPIALVCSFAIGFALFVVIAASAFFLYGVDIKTNLLNNFTDGYILLITMAIVAIQCLLCVALGINTLFQDLEDTLGIPDMFGWRRACLRTTVMLLVLFVSESIPHFGVALELVGGLLVTPFIFIFPPIFFAVIKYKTSGQVNIKEIVIGIEIVIVGIIGCVGATIDSAYQISLVTKFSPPCYIDFIAASELPDN